MPLRDGDIFILAVCLAGLALIVGGLFAWLGPGEAMFEEEEEEEEEQQQLQVRGGGGGGIGGLRRRRGEGAGGAARPRQLRRALREEGQEEEGDEKEGEGDEAGNRGEVAEERRQRKKDKIKADKKALKEEMRRAREEGERRLLLGLPSLPPKEDEEDWEVEEEEEEEEEEEAKAIRIKREEEESEFQKWKAMMQVEGEGNTAEEEMEEEDLLSSFVVYIKERKVVLLDELSARFNLPVKVVVERLEVLEGMGRLRGVVDDRGKYIEIEEEEMEGVRRWVVGRGRVGVGELARESNRLIKLGEGRELS